MHMIEIEKKFHASPEALSCIDSACVFVGKRINTDIYYDTPDYRLTTQNIWLRTRNEHFQMKTPFEGGKKKGANLYHEWETDSDIQRFLGFPSEETLLDSLHKNNITPFVTLTTHRTKYKKDDYTLDIDQTAAPDFSFSAVEIEILVSNPSESDDALRRILELGKQWHLNSNIPHGKVVQFLQEHRPHHYQALLKADICK